MNLDVALIKTVDSCIRRLRDRIMAAKREEERNNYASCGPTRDHLIKKGQALLDRNHDYRIYLKSAQVGPKIWWVWDTHTLTEEALDDPLLLHLPGFVRVRILHLYQCGDKIFVKCPCGRREREGVPCACFFKVLDDAGIPTDKRADICMVDARYLKMYHLHYGEDGPMGKLMYRAQNKCFLNEGKGTQATSEMAEKITGKQGIDYPILSSGTTVEDFNEARFIRQNAPVTCLDLECYRQFEEGQC